MAAANNEFFEALSMLEHERGITAEYLIEKIKAAIVIAVKKNYEVEDDNVMVEIDPATGKFNVALLQNVVADEDWYDEHAEIGLTEAQKLRKSYEIGDRVVTPLKTKDFGRIAAQTAKHVIRQGIREAERSQQLSEIQSRAHDIIQATVTRVDNEKGIVALDLGKGGEAILPRNEQVPGEVYTEGETLQVYVVDVVSGERGARVMISRTHPGLVKRLFELEVPEIYDGTVEVKAISREAGARTKMAVWSKDPNVNPVSACIGPHGDRVAAVVEKLGGEKIDIVKWSEDVSEFISAALSPAKVSNINVDEENIKALAAALNVSEQKVKDRINQLHQANPMMGFRGVRLCVAYPEIYAMLAKAIIQAAVKASKELGHDVEPEIMIPLCGELKEYNWAKKVVVEAVEKEMAAEGKTLKYQVGTMIEIPRGALRAGDLAKEAAFFSFGTNDLTQLTMGFSRDDSGQFLPYYYDRKIYEFDPFQTIDVEGVGELVKIAVERGRATNPNLLIGVCGETGGDPRSIEFYDAAGLDYVSCSPFRIPLARLAAAQAALKHAK